MRVNSSTQGQSEIQVLPLKTVKYSASNPKSAAAPVAPARGDGIGSEAVEVPFSWGSACGGGDQLGCVGMFSSRVVEWLLLL